MPKPVAFDPIALIKSPRVIGDNLSNAQETFLRALWGLPLNAVQRETYTRATGYEYTAHEYREAVAICGRRSGKSSRLAANVAIVEALFRKHELTPGEKGWVVIVAPTRRQAQIVFSYVLARLRSSPAMRGMIAGDPRADEVDLVNGISICTLPAAYRWIRGFSVVTAILDEEAFFFDTETNVNPASEILKALRPSMASFENAKLVRISSPFAKVGNLWESWRDRDKHPEVLTWRLGTREMNPSINAKFLEEEQRRDAESYAREYEAEFYESASMFLSSEAVEACVVRGRYQLAPQSSAFYWSALDAAFRGDHFGFSLVHRDAAGKVIVDQVRSWRGTRANPVNLANVLAEISQTLRSYRVHKIFGDQFCAEPIKQALKQQSIEFEQATTLGTRAAGLWGTIRMLVAERNIELLDDEETASQLKRLQLIATAGGSQRIEAMTGHDDRAVSLALAVHQAVAGGANKPWMILVDAPTAPYRPSWAGGGETIAASAGVARDLDGISWHRLE